MVVRLPAGKPQKSRARPLPNPETGQLTLRRLSLLIPRPPPVVFVSRVFYRLSFSPTLYTLLKQPDAPSHIWEMNMAPNPRQEILAKLNMSLF